MHMFGIMLIILLTISLSLMTLFIFCACILAKRADEQKIELLEKE